MLPMMQKTPRLAAALLVLSLAGCGVFGRCQDGTPPGERPMGPGGPPPHSPPRDPAFAKAFDACLDELGSDVERDTANRAVPGRPAFDRQAMDTCLKGKGVEPPAPPPRPREHR